MEENLAKIGYTEPTPIQDQSIPKLLEGNDLLGIAQTGTGKTAAFALPLLNLLARNKAKAWPTKCRSLILVPTRELASQVHADIKNYAQGLSLSTVVIFGGVNQRNQVAAMKKGVDILIATPGRLEDLIQQNHVRLDGVHTLILDEADRMLDMGFIPAIRRLVKQLPAERQTLLFSATMPNTISDLANSLLRNPVKVEVSPESTTVERIEQQLIYVPTKKKTELLIRLLDDEDISQAIIFSRTKHGAERLSKSLRKEDFDSDAIHGNKSQNARQRALRDFKEGKLHILVATDIASRGIDVDGVSHVFNYDLPTEPESYVHRIGRTGRAGREGVAISFCGADEMKRLRGIERSIQQKIPLMDVAHLDWEQAVLVEEREEKTHKTHHRRPDRGASHHSKPGRTGDSGKPRGNRPPQRRSRPSN